MSKFRGDKWYFLYVLGSLCKYVKLLGGLDFREKYEDYLKLKKL